MTRASYKGCAKPAVRWKWGESTVGGIAVRVKRTSTLTIHARCSQQDGRFTTVWDSPRRPRPSTW